MKNKVFILVTLILFLGVGTLFAETGIGAAFGYNRWGTSNIALSLDVDAIPGDVQTVSMAVNNSYFALGVTDDWYLIDDTFADPFGWYFGLGFYVNLGFGGGDVYTALGARAPIGLDVTLLKDQLVLYLEAAPILGVGVTPEFYFPHWDILGSFGFRFYF